jgi:hypothetical protein
MKTLRVPWVLTVLLLGALTCHPRNQFDAGRLAHANVAAGSGPITSLSFDTFGAFNIMDTDPIKNQGINKDQIRSARVHFLGLSVTKPASGLDFSFLQNIDFYIEADGLEPKLIARGADFAGKLNAVGLDAEDVELEAYFKAPFVRITNKAQGDAPNADITIEAHISIQLDVNQSGALCATGR